MKNDMNDKKICPKCMAENKKELIEAYGKVSQKEYEKLQHEIELITTPSMTEDFGAQIDENGKFSVWYWCKCSECGFEFEYNFEKDVLETK